MPLFFFSYNSTNRDNASWERFGEKGNFLDEFYQDLCKNVSDLTGGNNQTHCAWHAMALHMAGRESEARAVAERVADLPPRAGGLYNLACYHARAGHRDKAIASLQGAIDLGALNPHMGRDPDLATLHDDPEFRAMVEDVNERLRKP